MLSGLLLQGEYVVDGPALRGLLFVNGGGADIRDRSAEEEGIRAGSCLPGTVRFVEGSQFIGRYLHREDLAFPGFQLTGLGEGLELALRFTVF